MQCDRHNGQVSTCKYTRLLFHLYTFHAYTSTRVLPQGVYFHVFTSTRRVFPRMYFHEICTLHDMSKRSPHKHITGMHCSIAVVPCKITCGKMKLQLSGTVYQSTVHILNFVSKIFFGWQENSWGINFCGQPNISIRVSVLSTL